MKRSNENEFITSRYMSTFLTFNYFNELVNCENIGGRTCNLFEFESIRRKSDTCNHENIPISYKPHYIEHE